MLEKFAFVFPGQGSQYVGMLADYVDDSIVCETLSEASDLLGLNFLSLFANGPSADLNKTENTQPALLVASVALWRLWCSRNSGAQPVYMAGHSLGEYSALVCSGVLSFRDAVILVRRRGIYMQEVMLGNKGAMAAVLGLIDKDVVRICAESAHDQIVEAVNFNSPGQVVIAGDAAAVERAMNLAKKRGAKKIVLLPVSVPSHCALMKPAAEKLKNDLKDIRFYASTVPILHNVSADSCSELDGVRECLVAQLYSPVRWVETISTMHQYGVSRFVECGVGKVLSALNKRIVRGGRMVSLDTLAGMNDLLDW